MFGRDILPDRAFYNFSASKCSFRVLELLKKVFCNYTIEKSLVGAVILFRTVNAGPCIDTCMTKRFIILEPQNMWIVVSELHQTNWSAEFDLSLKVWNVSSGVGATRRALPQFWSFKIRGSTNFMSFRNVRWRILNCERSRRDRAVFLLLCRQQQLRRRSPADFFKINRTTLLNYKKIADLLI